MTFTVYHDLRLVRYLSSDDFIIYRKILDMKYE